MQENASVKDKNKDYLNKCYFFNLKKFHQVKSHQTLRINSSGRSWNSVIDNFCLLAIFVGYTCFVPYTVTYTSIL